MTTQTERNIAAWIAAHPTTVTDARTGATLSLQAARYIAGLGWVRR